MSIKSVCLKPRGSSLFIEMQLLHDSLTRARLKSSHGPHTWPPDHSLPTSGLDYVPSLHTLSIESITGDCGGTWHCRATLTFHRSPQSHSCAVNRASERIADRQNFIGSFLTTDRQTCCHWSESCHFINQSMTACEIRKQRLGQGFIFFVVKPGTFEVFDSDNELRSLSVKKKRLIFKHFASQYHRKKKRILSHIKMILLHVLGNLVALWKHICVPVCHSNTHTSYF